MSSTVCLQPWKTTWTRQRSPRVAQALGMYAKPVSFRPSAAPCPGGKGGVQGQGQPQLKAGAPGVAAGAPGCGGGAGSMPNGVITIGVPGMPPGGPGTTGSGEGINAGD